MHAISPGQVVGELPRHGVGPAEVFVGVLPVHEPVACGRGEPHKKICTQFLSTNKRAMGQGTRERQ